jgi:hypothetical protein
VLNEGETLSQFVTIAISSNRLNKSSLYAEYKLLTPRRANRPTL